jgi:hypothetical protein
MLKLGRSCPSTHAQNATPITTRLVTGEELLRMPDGGYRYELIRMALVKMTPSGHGSIEFGEQDS